MSSLLSPLGLSNASLGGLLLFLWKTFGDSILELNYGLYSFPLRYFAPSSQGVNGQQQIWRNEIIFLDNLLRKAITLSITEGEIDYTTSNKQYNHGVLLPLGTKHNETTKVKPTRAT